MDRPNAVEVLVDHGLPCQQTVEAVYLKMVVGEAYLETAVVASQDRVVFVAFPYRWEDDAFPFGEVESYHHVPLEEKVAS